MKQSEKSSPASRRGFLRGLLGLGGGAAALAASRVVPAATMEEPTEPARQQGDVGYHETQHVLDYYEKARG